MAIQQEALSPSRIIVVEDETDLGTLLEYLLGREGFDVSVARTGTDALRELQREPPDLILLDLMLPDMEGFEILREIRKSGRTSRTRVIVLSARKGEDDRIRGFELGADDYIVKPFSPRELLWRVKTVLQRESPGTDRTAVLTAGPIELDEGNHEARVGGRPIYLTLTEFRLLASLVRNQGRVRSREALLSEVWGYDAEAMSRTVDTHIRRVRTKLGSSAAWLGTVRGIGYRLRDPRKEAADTDR